MATIKTMREAINELMPTAASTASEAATAATAQQLAPGLHKRKRDEHTFDPDRKYLCYACYEEIIPIFEDGVCQNIERICHEYGVRYFHTNCAPTVQPGRKRRSK